MESCEVREEMSLDRSTPPEILPLSGNDSVERSNRQDAAAPPCFFSRVCGQRAAIEKAGRSVCRGCAETRLRGIEYPLRGAASEPLYLTGRAALEALDMVEFMSQQARRGLRGGSWS